MVSLTAANLMPPRIQLDSRPLWIEELCERLKMSFTRTAKAVVVSCSLAASEQVTVDLTVMLYQVQARVLESQYGDDVYMVTVVRPERQRRLD